MNEEVKRIRITCPKCDGFIASAPEDDLPEGDLVCPNCNEVVRAPSQVDKVIEEVKQAVKETLNPSDKEDRSK